jgi:hypothetical protein
MGETCTNAYKTVAVKPEGGEEITWKVKMKMYDNIKVILKAKLCDGVE